MDRFDRGRHLRLVQAALFPSLLQKHLLQSFMNAFSGSQVKPGSFTSNYKLTID